MTASQAAQPPTAGPSEHGRNPLGQWQRHGASSDSPPSSTPASDQFTPDSDSDGNDAGPGLLGSGHGDGPESYELKDRRNLSGREYAFDEDNDGDEKHHGRGSSGRPSRRRGRAAARADTAATLPPYTPDEERAVVKKFDRRLVVFLALLYMLSFLDRSSAS